MLNKEILSVWEKVCESLIKIIYFYREVSFLKGTTQNHARSVDLCACIQEYKQSTGKLIEMSETFSSVHSIFHVMVYMKLNQLDETLLEH